jgi:peptide deformylase
MDHLNGVLIVERLDADTRREAMRVLRNRALDPSVVG